MDTAPVTQIVEEIYQIVAQYQQEVPGQRRALPESIKSRVIQLRKAGLPTKQIAELTGLSYYTIMAWIPAEFRRTYQKRQSDTGHFKALQIQSRQQSATVTVTLPNGVRIEGVTPEFLSAWIGRGAQP